jgi:hypothetical protein
VVTQNFRHGNNGKTQILSDIFQARCHSDECISKLKSGTTSLARDRELGFTVTGCEVGVVPAAALAQAVGEETPAG